jgi:hypothetical protein
MSRLLFTPLRGKLDRQVALLATMNNPMIVPDLLHRHLAKRAWLGDVLPVLSHFPAIERSAGSFVQYGYLRRRVFCFSV